MKDNCRNQIVSVSVALFIFMILALPGCGKKGPLYLPEKPPQIVDQPADDKESGGKASKQGSSD